MLVLASASPRRRELLAQAGYEFVVRPAHVNEDVLPGEDPIAYVTRLARVKAMAAFAAGGGDQGSGIGNRTELVVLGADTTVTVDGHILAKPEDAADAARMLRMLSGRTHRVMTGVAVVRGSSHVPKSEGHVASASMIVEVAAEVTAVTFLTLSDAEIDAYIATGEPMDKAGAYAIQGRAAKWIPRIEGCYFNVVGLPLALVATMLESGKSREQATGRRE